ncbi:hypothetical protein [Nonomuraea sp. NPDC050691]|uniref:hypothetical protein n=1 Tax=Nonomuraea sp. NPDC050691 TaxID=3155661 RepID=UPI0033E2DD15
MPLLAARGHHVTATTTSAARLGLLEQLGAEAVVMDGLGAVSAGEAVAQARPEVIVQGPPAHGPTGTCPSSDASAPGARPDLARSAWVAGSRSREPAFPDA